MMQPFASAIELRRLLDEGAISAQELASFFIERVKQHDPELNAFVFFDPEAVLAQAQASDRRLREGSSRPLEGIPVAIKDIFCVRGEPTTACSRILEGFRPPYDAHVIERLRAAGAVLFGKTNMDEFAMGSSNETSCYGPCRNPWDLARTPGGSSGGSAAAVAAGLAPLALGTDTGGSIRQPAALCGIVGIKPTYGRVSRRGIIAFASSLDQAGPMARTVADAALLLEAIAGHDPRDATSAADAPPLGALEAAVRGAERGTLQGLRIGKPKEYFPEDLDAGVRAAVERALDRCAELGAEIVEISLPHSPYAVAAYYVIAPSEASANLARYDGVRFGRRCKDAKDLFDLYARSRGEGFGDEVKRRILMGTFALSAGYYEAFYGKAQRVRTLIRQDFEKAFSEVDLIAAPTSPTTAFRLGEKSDPVAMYLSDVFTVAASLAGLPAMSQPCGFVGELPVGLQWIAPAWQEERMIEAAAALEASLALSCTPARFGGER